MKDIMNKEALAYLNKCVTHELSNHNLYMNASYWCIANGYMIAGEFFKKQAHQELEHMEKVMAFVNDRNEQPIIGKVEEQSAEYSNIISVVKAGLDREVITEDLYSNLDEFSDDVAGVHILAFDMLKEQVEEIGLFGDIMAEVQLVSDGGKELSGLVKQHIDSIFTKYK
jgi:ferritin